MEVVALAFVGLIVTFPMSIQIAIVFIVLAGGMLLLARSLLAAIKGTKFDMPKKRRK